MPRDPRDAYWRFETQGFLVAAYVDDEDMDPSEQLDAEACEDIRAGRTVWFCVTVEVTHRATGRVVGFDALGGCSYSSVAEFFEAHRDPDPMARNCSVMRAARGQMHVVGHYWPDMVGGAVREARATFRAQLRPERLVEALVAAQQVQAQFTSPRLRNT